MQNSPLHRFYEEKFGSALEIASYFSSDFENHAAEIGVNWSAVADKLSYQGGKGSRFVASKKHQLVSGCKDSVAIYSSIEEKDGIRYPLITLKNKGGKGDTVVINGWYYLVQAFKDQKDQNFSSESFNQWQADKAQRQADQKAKLAKAQRDAELEEKRMSANVQREIAEHNELPAAKTTQYAAKKKVVEALSLCDARIGTHKDRGEFLSFLLRNIHGEVVGVQRIYNKKFKTQSGGMTNKDFTWGMKKAGAFMAFGDFINAEIIYLAEGWATAASIYLAMKDEKKSVAVIVAMDANNKLAVREAFAKARPWLDAKFVDAVDNDLWKCQQGKGNTGMLIACELISKFECKAVVPNVDAIDKVYQATDWNDIHVHLGMVELKRQLKSNPCKFALRGNSFTNALTRLAFVSHTMMDIEAKEAVNTAMSMFPIYSGKEILSMIDLALAHGKGKYNRRALKDTIVKIFKGKVRQAQSARSFSWQTKNASYVTYKKFAQKTIDAEVQSYLEAIQSGIVIVRAGKGSGKTESVITPAMWGNEYTAFFAHRVSLIGDAEGKFNDIENKNTKRLMGEQLPVIAYNDENIDQLSACANKLACCINSVTKPKFFNMLQKLDTICIDEACQTIRHICSGGAIQFPQSVFNRLLDLMTNTNKVIMADADANDVLVDFALVALERRNEQLRAEGLPEETIHIVELPSSSEDISVKYTNLDSVFLLAVDAVASNEKVLVATDSSNEAEALFKQIMAQCPNKKGLLINAKEKETSKDVIAFCDNAEKEQFKYDFVIYSPSISSGVSIKMKHFTRHFGMFRGVVTPSDALQMLHRDRTAKEFIIGMGSMNTTSEDDVWRSWLGLQVANDNKLQVSFNKDTNKIEVATADMQFDRFRIDLAAQENRAKASFASDMVCILTDEKYQVSKLDVSNIDPELAEKLKAEATGAVKLEQLSRFLDAETPSEEQYKALKEQRTVTVEEKAAMDRFVVENEFCLPCTEDSYALLNNGGMRQLANFELMTADIADLKKLDDEEIKNSVPLTDRHYFVKRRRLLDDFFSITGINIKNGKCWTTAEKLQKAMAHICSSDEIHFFNNYSRISGRIDPITHRKKVKVFMDGVLNSLGLSTVSLQLARVDLNESQSRKRYAIERESFDFMQKMLNARSANRRTALKVCGLEVIHKPSSVYIDEGKNVDHALEQVGEKNKPEINHLSDSDKVKNLIDWQDSRIATLANWIDLAVSGTNLSAHSVFDMIMSDDWRSVLDEISAGVVTQAHFCQLVHNLGNKKAA